MLDLPDTGNRRARDLAASWRQRYRDDRDLVQAALRYFREQPFHYTLEPPRLSGDTVDGFLFNTRRGFCEHYASSFTFLMRAAGIPARVVAGYQGGEPNGDYLQIRQYDAHAWTEVWLNGRWVRVDPTGAVAPERIELGLRGLVEGAPTPAATPWPAPWAGCRCCSASSNGWITWTSTGRNGCSATARRTSAP
ncbi:transglutaminase domain-containing protein [Alcanivorax sp. IO_7]|nr:transglutaminase domain-containing protein [Alcanivorax sp. IO_7]